MERCVDDLDIICYGTDDIGMDDLLFQLFHVGVVDLAADDIVKACIHGSLLIHCLNIVIIGYGIDLSDYASVMRRCNLCTVFPVNLISVVLGRIVRSSDHNTCDALKCAKRI